MKPKARKNRDYLFSIFHKLNLEDAINYVSEVRAQTGVIYCTILSFVWFSQLAFVSFNNKVCNTFTYNQGRYSDCNAIHLLPVYCQK